MGNTVSHGSGRRCGLCYFKLEKEAPFLKEPSVSRKALPIFPVSPWVDGALDDIFQPPKDIMTVQLKTKLHALHDSSSRGCVGCAAILQCLQDQLDKKGFIADQKSLQEECKLTWLVGDREIFNPSLQLEILVRKSTEDTYKKFEFVMSLFYAGNKAPHPAARKVQPTIAESYTGSSASLDVLKMWLQDCDASHQACKQPTSPLPYRVLQLHKDPQGHIQVTLVEDLKTDEPYACLSHRWGASTLRCRTLTDTIATHLKSVPWDQLPKTFQQACAVTLELGLKYIWIDSLCIIQDDKEDWKVQAAQMCSIYRGSYITIAATSSNDSDQGMFWRVPKFPIQVKSSSSHDVFIREAPEHQYGIQDLSDDDYPLLSRGWVYQERLLAPRVVHFGRSELRFEDIKATAQCECGMEVAWPRKESHHRSLSVSDIAEVRSHWHEIVGQFSTLNLTFYSDYLPALAGIARQYGTAHQDVLGQYVAGLWEKTLVYDLLWYVSDGYNSRRQEVCNAPSWSWASTSAGTGGMLRYTRASEDLEIMEFHVALAGPDEYGPIDSAELIVQGYLAVGSWKWVTENGLERRIHFCHEPEDKTYYVYLDYNWSVSGSSRYVPEGSKIYCLKTGFVGDGCHVCLIMRAVDDEEKVFERIGLLEAPKDAVESWFVDCKTPETIKII